MIIAQILLVGFGLVLIGFCIWLIVQAVQSRRRHQRIIAHIETCRTIGELLECMEKQNEKR